MSIILDSYKKKLLNAGIKNANNEINWFLEKKFSFSKEDIILKNISLNNQQIEIFTDFINRRIQKEPFQYILNFAPFCNIDIYVNSHVLIPRPETETIINVLIKQNKKFISALDLCCGSGNLAIMLSLKNIAKTITAIDISEKALKVARKNFKNFKIKNIDCCQLDFLNQKINKKFDLIVCNPPYISNEEYKKLNDQIKNHEPLNALTDKKDGLSFYKKIHQEIKNIINPNGTILLEIGLEKNKQMIEKIFANEKFKWHKDLNNNYRIIQIYK